MKTIQRIEYGAITLFQQGNRTGDFHRLAQVRQQQLHLHHLIFVHRTVLLAVLHGNVVKPMRHVVEPAGRQRTNAEHAPHLESKGRNAQLFRHRDIFAGDDIARRCVLDQSCRRIIAYDFSEILFDLLALPERAESFQPGGQFLRQLVLIEQGRRHATEVIGGAVENTLPMTGGQADIVNFTDQLQRFIRDRKHMQHPLLCEHPMSHFALSASTPRTAARPSRQ